ncbi:MAG: GntR family transcriptional regulator [Janthinobacterium lividum]
MSAEPSRGTVDLDRSTVSRYIQLATLFRRRIETGIWVEGARIPTVDELAAEYGVARATIRQALGQVEAAGLIQRFRAKGTFVRCGAPERLWCEVQTDWGGLLRSREGATIEILEVDADAQPPSLLPGSGTAAPSYRRLRRRHWRDGQAFLLATLFLDERLWTKVTPEDLRTRTALNLVASLPGVRVVDARQTLTIGSADVEVAAGLGIPLNAPVAYVDRTATDETGAVVLVAAGIYRGDLVRIDLSFSSAAPGQAPAARRD